MSETDGLSLDRAASALQGAGRGGGARARPLEPARNGLLRRPRAPEGGSAESHPGGRIRTDPEARKAQIECSAWVIPLSHIMGSTAQFTSAALLPLPLPLPL